MLELIANEVGNKDSRHRILISNDLYQIAKRLKRINPKYQVFRESATGRVEVHTSPRPCALSLEFVVPFTELDERTLEYAQKTRIENFDVLEADVARTNAELETSAQRSARATTAILGDMMNYAGNQVHEVRFTKTKRWI